VFPFYDDDGGLQVSYFVLEMETAKSSKMLADWPPPPPPPKSGKTVLRFQPFREVEQHGPHHYMTSQPRRPRLESSPP